MGRHLYLYHRRLTAAGPFTTREASRPLSRPPSYLRHLFTPRHRPPRQRQCRPGRSFIPRITAVPIKRGHRFHRNNQCLPSKLNLSILESNERVRRREKRRRLPTSAAFNPSHSRSARSVESTNHNHWHCRVSTLPSYRGSASLVLSLPRRPRPSPLSSILRSSHNPPISRRCPTE